MVLDLENTVNFFRIFSEYVYVHSWVEVRGQLPVFSFLYNYLFFFFKQVALSARLAGQQASRSSYICQPSAMVKKTPNNTLSFYMAAKDLNSGPHSSIANALPTELSL